MFLFLLILIMASLEHRYPVNYYVYYLTYSFMHRDNEGNGHKYSFWIYIGSISLDGLVSLFLAFMVITVKSSEGPHTLTKVSFCCKFRLT